MFEDLDVLQVPVNQHNLNAFTSQFSTNTIHRSLIHLHYLIAPTGGLALTESSYNFVFKIATMCFLKT